MATVSVLKAATNGNGNGNDTITLPDGTNVRILPVSAALLERVSRAIPDPAMPTVHDETTNRDIPNPGDPDYIRALQEVSEQRNSAAVDALIMFGVELVDGVPEDDKWLAKLIYMEKLGHDVGLSEFNTDDPMDREYLYKRFVLASGNILDQVTRASGISQEDVKSAEDSFRSK